MSEAIQIKVEDGGAIARLGAFPAQAAQATMRAVNRTAEWCRTRTLEAITANLAVKKSDLDGRHRFGGVTVRKAKEKGTAGVDITGARVPLFRFHGKPTAPPSRHGISYQIDAGGGRKRIGQGVFVARMKSGHQGFFKRMSTLEELKHYALLGGKKNLRAKRRSTKRAMIMELFGPSIPHVADHRPEFRKLLEVDAGARLELQMEREVNFILTGTSKGGG